MIEVRDFKISYILTSVLYLVLGAVLLLWPDQSVQMICYVLGFAMIVIGITYGITYFMREQSAGLLRMDLVIGIVCIGFGAFILLNQGFLQSVLPFAMGIILLLGAVIKIQNALDMKHLRFGRWYIVLICAILLAVLGAVLLINPFSSGHWMIIYIGGCLVLDAFVSLISMGCILVRLKRMRKLQRKYPDRIITPEDLLEQKQSRQEIVVSSTAKDPDDDTE